MIRRWASTMEKTQRLRCAMRRAVQFTVLLLVLFLESSWVAAATYTCSVSATAPTNATYNQVTNTGVAITLGVTCTRTTGGAKIAWTITAVPGLGANESGGHNVANAGSLLPYNYYTDAACTTPWTGSTWSYASTNVASPPTPTPTPATVYLCAPATSPVPPAATNPTIYTDSFNVNWSSNNVGATVTGSPTNFTARVNVPQLCLISNMTNVNFNTYAAFSATTYASGNFKLQCNKNLSIPSMNVGGTSDGVMGTGGLYYTVVLNTSSGNGTGSHPLTSVTTTGNQDTIYINGTLPQQAGSCSPSCALTETRTLTVNY